MVLTEFNISIEQLKSLSAKLDAMDLTDDERATLNAVLAAAGKAVAESQDEVTGHSGWPWGPTPVGLGGGSLESFSWGATSPGAVGFQIER